MSHKFFHFHQERYSKPFLLLEIGMLHLRLHSINAGRQPISIATLREDRITPGDITLLIETVRNVLDTDSAVRDLAIVMNSPAIRHQIFGIPHLSAAERQKVLHHEMKQTSPSGDTPGRMSHWSAGRIKEPAASKEYALCAEINPSVADGLIAAAQEKKFRLIGFTSYAQMASHLLRECPMGDNLNVALLEADDREGSITLFHSNIWNMDRHFLIGGSGIQADSPAFTGIDAEKVKLEVGRALQYFKQQVRNENISHIFLFGATSHALGIQKLLEASFRIPVTLLALEGKKFAAKDSVGGQDGNLPLYGIAHAAALHAHFDKYISFLPPEWRGEKHVKGRQLALIASAVAYYAFLGGMGCMLNREATKVTARERASTQSLLLHPNAAQQTQQTRASRSFALATEQSEEWLRDRHRVVAELARELAGAAPPQMRIAMMEVTEKGDAWQVKLQAEIRSPNGSLSQQLFLDFQDQMKRLMCLEHLTWGEVRLGDSETAQPADLNDPAPKAQNLLTFTMQGMLSYTAVPVKPPSNPPTDPIHS